ncbi:MAG: putative sugar nucleotidyl transferase [Balneolaceae bacterium]|nr:putative sugar nucleotidyl transferase [Balneolaceae bacterium]
MQICFFEDQLLHRFHPLTLTRPVDDLRLGITTIREKWEQELDATRSARLLRNQFQGLFEQGSISDSEPCTWINARYLPSQTLLGQIQELDVGSSLQNAEGVIAAKVDGPTSTKWHQENKPQFKSLMVLETDEFNPLQHLWDLFQLNREQIAADIKRFDKKSSGNARISTEAVLEQEDQIYIEEGAVIEPGAILMADTGPIFIGRNATVSAGAIIKGPVAIGEDSVVKMGARIYDATTIGPVCKAGGEISNSIFHSYSNKGHEGYVGNSLIGQWCNIGAGTNTSNLKNNYSTIRLTEWKSRQEEETGQQFIGTIMGDHSKTAINVQLNTGTVCGVSCNIFTSDFPRNSSPPSPGWAPT